MQDKTVNLNLDLNAPPVILHVTQGDTAWRWHFCLFLDGSRWTIPTGAQIILKGLKPDGHVFAFSGEISSNEAIVTSDLQMTICAGEVLCSLIILDADAKRLAFGRIAMYVAADAEGQFDVASESALPAYAELLSQYGDIVPAAAQTRAAAAEALASKNAAAASATAAAASAAAAAASETEAKRVEASIPADYSVLSADVGDLKSQITVTKTGNPNDFTNNYLDGNAMESTSEKLALTKRYFNYQQDKLISVETTEPYGIYAYGFERAKYLGLLREDGTFAQASSSPALYADKINLSDYADITFKFGLRHNENGTSLNVSTSEAVNIKFTFKLGKELARRKISVIGDSISSFTGYVSPGSPDAYYPLPAARMYYLENMYWKTLADRNGMTIDVIDAFAGSTVADKWQDTARIPFTDDSRVNRLGTPDVIIVEGGINDFGGNPLGDYPAIGDYTKTYEFRTAYSLLLNKLKTKYTRATIICLSMMSPRSYNNTTFPEKQTEVKQALATDTTPHTFSEFNESIEHIAKQYQCAYCDITDLLDYYLNPTSALGPHWFFNYHLEVAYRIEQLLKQIFA